MHGASLETCESWLKIYDHLIYRNNMVNYNATLSLYNYNLVMSLLLNVYSGRSPWERKGSGRQVGQIVTDFLYQVCRVSILCLSL